MNSTCPRCGMQTSPGRLSLCPICVLENEDEPVLIAGTLELHEELGRGGMGTVFKARHLRLNRFVAVKFLPENLAQQQEFQTRFEREARALALLNHPNIVTVYDFGREGDQSYLVMEYVEGGSLAKLIPMPLDRALELALQICDALSYAHRQGVIHRDIKPENILIDSAGRVKVGDFGLARMMRPEARGWTVTTPDVAVGTPHFMAPEALAGAAPDPRMDVYSLGVLFYELIMGTLPLGAFTPPPHSVERCIRKALAPDPALRYSSVDDFRHDLSNAMRPSGAGAAAEPAPSDELAPDEKIWLSAVALLQSISTAVAIWAFLECITPKEILRQNYRPMEDPWVQKLPNGNYYSPARFEMWPTVATLMTFVLAISAYGLLRRHWRLSGLECARPDQAVRESEWVLRVGAVAIVLCTVRMILSRLGFDWARTHIPILGAAVEISALFFVWISILQSWRASRALIKERRIWLGLSFALVPPVIEFLKLTADPVAMSLASVALVGVICMRRR